MVTPLLPNVWNPIYERFSKREDGNSPAEAEKCGWTTHRGTLCQWPRPCAIHAEKRREHEARVKKGICGASLRSGGGVCQKVRGECAFHAPEEVRCKSTLETKPTEQCYNRRIDGSDYCDKHAEYPNLGARLRDYIADLGGLRAFAENNKAFLQEFFEKEYPEARADRPDLVPIIQGMIL